MMVTAYILDLTVVDYIAKAGEIEGISVTIFDPKQEI
jgi:hypothetical protein